MVKKHTLIKKTRLIVFAAAIVCLFAVACENVQVTDTPKIVFSYTVNYYMESEGGDYALAKIDRKKVSAEKSRFSVGIPVFEGYVFAEDNSGNVTTLDLKENALNTFCLYYDIIEFTVTAKVDGETRSEEKVKYGCVASIPATPKKQGFVFGEWRSDEGGKFDFSEPVRKDVVLSATWVKSDEEIDNYALIAADWYYKESDDEYVYMLGKDKSLSLLVNGATMGDGTYKYGKDGFITFSFNYGTIKGTTAIGEMKDRYLHLEDGKVLSRYGYTVYDFSSASELSVVTNSVPADWFGSAQRTASITFVDAVAAAGFPEREGSVGVHGGAVGVALEQYPLSDNPQASEFYRGGVTIDLGGIMKTEGLRIVIGLYVVDYKGGDGRIRSSNDEVLLFGTVGSNGIGSFSPQPKWVTVGRGGAPVIDVETWMAIEVSAEEFTTYEEIDNIYIKSIRDDDFYIDYVAYYYV